jgi:hypothetical protein
MFRSSVKFACLGGAVLLGLGACAELPPDVSPNYIRVPIVSPENPNKVKYVLVPEACLDRDPTVDNTLGETLPPGCANAYNLQRMTERKSDVEHGRPLGKAAGVTTAKAAKKYLDGKEESLGGATTPEAAAPGEASDTVNSPSKAIKPKS